MRPVKKSKNLIIIGKGESSYMAQKFLDMYGNADIWRLNQGSGWQLETNATIWHFEIHDPIHLSDDDIRNAYKTNGVSYNNMEVVRRGDVDIASLIRKYGNRFFANTIAIQMALALSLGYEAVGLPGCDIFDVEEEAKLEEASVVFWYGLLSARGVWVSQTDKCTIFKNGTEFNRTCWEAGKALGRDRGIGEDLRSFIASINVIYK